MDAADGHAAQRRARRRCQLQAAAAVSVTVHASLSGSDRSDMAGAADARALEVLALRDGRALAFRVYGAPLDDTTRGMAVLYFHGVPSCHVRATMAAPPPPPPPRRPAPA